MFLAPLFLLFSLIIVIAQAQQAQQQQKIDKSINHHESCEYWASIGECSKNPNYMLNYCSPACQQVSKAESSKPIPQSFYEIMDKDIHGNEIDFHRFQGKVVYVINVASHCGYTEENYRQFKTLQKYYSDGLEIVLLPCNSFGNQEPGNKIDIQKFADSKGFSGIILEKGEVNGNLATPLFKFLKGKTGKDRINWNFDGKFIVDRNGGVHLPTDDLEGDIRKYLNEDYDL